MSERFSKNVDPAGCPDQVTGDCAPACAYCGRDMADELERLHREVAEHRRLQTLGGIPPEVDKNWANETIGRPDSAHDPLAPPLRRAPNQGAAGELGLRSEVKG